MTLARALPAFLRVALAVMFQYRGEIILWAVWGVVYPAVAIAMWSAAIAGSPTGTDIGGYEASGFAAYFLMTMIIGHVTTAWDVYEMGWLVRNGAMSAKLLRPVLPIWEALCDNLAYKLLTLVILVPIWGVVALAAEPRFEAGALQLALGILAALLAAVMSFLWGYVVALSAFWVTRTDAISEMWFALGLFLGGRLAPMSVLPGLLAWLATLLPFRWMIWFPAEVLIGRLAPTEIVAGLVWQAAWLVLGLGAFSLAWRRAVRRYSAVGA